MRGLIRTVCHKSMDIRKLLYYLIVAELFRWKGSICQAAEAFLSVQADYSIKTTL